MGNEWARWLDSDFSREAGRSLFAVRSSPFAIRFSLKRRTRDASYRKAGPSTRTKVLARDDSFDGECREIRGDKRKAKAALSRVGVEQPDQPEGQHGDHGRCGDGENPGPHDAGGNSPAHSRETLRSSDTDNSAGDGVRGADRNSGQRGAEQRDCAGGLGAEAANWLQFGDLGAHGVHDAPAT